MATKNYGRGANGEKDKDANRTKNRFEIEGKREDIQEDSRWDLSNFFLWTILCRRKIDDSLTAKSPGNMSTTNKYMNKILQRWEIRDNLANPVPVRCFFMRGSQESSIDVSVYRYTASETKPVYK